EIPGLKMRTLIKGSGETANYGDTLKMHYTGWLYDANTINNHGNKFDSSLDRGKLFEFKLGVDPLIKGWELGVTNMSVGESRELIISPEMGYGDRSLGGIPPQSTLLFHVELMDLVKID
ncbi:MAG: FKBP-type peptidyl-prolyl cis-trans isomerase, partial [Woeseiaceae bacterium]